MLQITIALVIFLFPLAYSPGPGNLFFAANGARYGFRATLPANAGYHLATWAVTAAIGFGFLATLNRSPEIFVVLKTAGALYVLWIAWKVFRSGTLRGDADAVPATFFDGIILLLLNPKAYVIITVMFTQFLGQTSAGPSKEVILITSVFTLNNLMAFSIWTFAGDKIARYFRTSKSAGKLNAILGTILAIVAIWMLFT